MLFCHVFELNASLQQPQQYSAMGGPPAGAQPYYGPQYGTPVYGAPLYVPLAGAQPYYGQPPQGVVLPGEFDAGARFDGTARPTIPVSLIFYLAINVVYSPEKV